ncbi:MAG: fasciclin domain-containing protein [Planctomycetaceae bacterium]
MAKGAWLTTAQGQSLRVLAKDGVVTVDGAKVIATDIETSNGIIHVIDTVVIPRKDIVDTALEAKSFRTLVTALKAAALVDALRGDGPFTVFAPTDEAFNRLPAGALDGLLENVAALQRVLTLHVIPGRVLSTDLAVGTLKVKSLEGSELTIVKGMDGSVTVNGAKVMAADVIAGNGVIHVIGGVITSGQ